MIDKEYFNYIYNTYSSSILKISYTYLKNTTLAEDILQDVLLKMMKRNVKFSNKDNEKYWIIKVTSNLCKDTLKSSWFKKNTELTDDLSYLPKEQEEILTEVFKLPEKYRIVIHLYYYEDYSIKQISKILNKKQSTIGTWLARGKTELKNYLEEDFKND